MSDRTTLVQRLRDVDRNPPNLHERQRIADELDRLNAQALELCAEISGLRRELGEALALLRKIGSELHDGDHRGMIDAFLAATAKEGER